jgi:hypothetical protein
MLQTPKVMFPPANSTFTWPKAPLKLVSHGRVPPAVQHVSGVMKNQAGQTVGTAKTIRHPKGGMRWAILFTGIPAGGPYTLQVLDADTGGVIVGQGGLDGGVPPPPAPLVSITAPFGGSTVCVPFTAYGSKSGSGSVSCALTKGSGSVSGSTDPEIDPEVWSAEFSGDIANSYDAILAAFGSASDSHPSITVLGSDGCG